MLLSHPNIPHGKRRYLVTMNASSLEPILEIDEDNNSKDLLVNNSLARVDKLVPKPNSVESFVTIDDIFKKMLFDSPKAQKNFFKFIMKFNNSNNLSNIVKCLSSFSFEDFWSFCVEQTVIDQIMENDNELYSFIRKLEIFDKKICNQFNTNGFDENCENITKNDPKAKLLLMLLRMKKVLSTFNCVPSKLDDMYKTIYAIAVEPKSDETAILLENIHKLDSLKVINMYYPTPQLLTKFSKLEENISNIALINVDHNTLHEKSLFDALFKYKNVKKLTITYQLNGNVRKLNIPIEKEISVLSNKIISLKPMLSVKNIMFCNLPSTPLSLVNLPNVECAFFVRCSTSEIQFGKITSLKSLEIRESTIVNSGQFWNTVATMVNLNHLRVFECKQLLGIPIEIMELTSLRTLLIGLEHCTDVKTQEVNGTRIKISRKKFTLPSELTSFICYGQCFKRNFPFMWFERCIYEKLFFVAIDNNSYTLENIRRSIEDPFEGRMNWSITAL